MKRFFGILLSLSILIGLIPSALVSAIGDATMSFRRYQETKMLANHASLCQHTAFAWEVTDVPVGLEAGVMSKICSDCGETLSTLTVYNLFGLGDEANADKTLTGIGENVSPDELTAHFGNLGYRVTVTDMDGNEADCVGTGSKVSLDGDVYEVILKGDASGDGAIDLFDLMALLDHVNGDSTLEGVFMTAGLIVNEEEVDLFDLMTLLDHINGDCILEPSASPSYKFLLPETGCPHIYETSVTATCIRKGYKTTTCIVCGDSKTEAIPALGHDYHSTVTDATCDVDGKKVTVCSRCGDSETITSPSTGHNYKSTSILATMTTDGEVRSVCEKCGDVKIQVLTAMEKDAVVAGTLTDHVVAKKNGFVYLDIESPLIALGGIAAPSLNNGELYRFSAANRGRYPTDIQQEGATTAGGTLRFRIKAIRRTDFNFFDKYGLYSFDIYVGSGLDRTLYQTVCSAFNENFESETITLPEGVREVMICLPYNMGFTDLQIAIEEDAYVAPAPARTGGTIGFYGSSITQGYDGGVIGAPVVKGYEGPLASRSYAMQLCLAFDADCMNFGLSGAARGEKVVIDDICAKIKDAGLTAFILDYDWNINSSSHLRDGAGPGYYGHYTIYEKLREALGPDVPIAMASRPYFGEGTGGISEDEITNCMRVIRASCTRALKAGDNAVAFLSGKTDFFGDEGASCHSDTVHPNDKGHSMMAAAF
ncbi:MAG: hypothetical protein IJD10_06045, partial [Clostridia bacterium]|nr:hypothetical protein [Clostridia bacterium]